MSIPTLPAGGERLRGLAAERLASSSCPWRRRRAQLASSAGARKQKGGPKSNTLVSPTRGTTGLGACLGKDGGDVEASVAAAFPTHRALRAAHQGQRQEISAP
eukprot:439668-Prymnesium_polylepis.1